MHAILSKTKISLLLPALALVASGIALVLGSSSVQVKVADAQACLFHLLGAVLAIALLRVSGPSDAMLSMLLGWTATFDGLYGMHVVRELFAQLDAGAPARGWHQVGHH